MGIKHLFGILETADLRTTLGKRQVEDALQRISQLGSAEEGKPAGKRLEEIKLIGEILQTLSAKPKSKKRKAEKRAESVCRKTLVTLLEGDATTNRKPDKSRKIRLESLKVLAAQKVRAYGPLFLKVAYTDHSNEVRVAAVQVLVDLEYSQALPCFHCWISAGWQMQKSVRLRMAVIKALSTLGDAGSIDELEGVLENEKSTGSEKQAAMESLSALRTRLGQEEAVQPVIGIGGKPSGAGNGRDCAHYVRMNGANRRAGANAHGTNTIGRRILFKV